MAGSRQNISSTLARHSAMLSATIQRRRCTSTRRAQNTCARNRFAVFGFDRRELALRDTHDEIAAAAGRFQKARVDALSVSCLTKSNAWRQPSHRGERFAVIGDALSDLMSVMALSAGCRRWIDHARRRDWTVGLACTMSERIRLILGRRASATPTSRPTLRSRRR